MAFVMLGEATLSFWDLVNGRPHNLDLEIDPSLSKVILPPLVSVPLAIVATAGAVAAVAAGVRPQAPLLMMPYRAWRMAKGDLDNVDDNLAAHEQAKREARRKRTEQLAAYLANAVCLNPKHIALRLYHARVLMALGNVERATDALRFALAVDSQNVPVWFALATLFDDKAETQQALKCIEQVIRLDSNNARAWCNRGVLMCVLGRTDEAMRSWNKVTDITPRDGSAWFNKANLLFELGKQDEAVESWSKAYSLDATCTPPWIEMLARAKKLENAGNSDQAAELFERALQMKPEYAEARLGRALIAIGKGNLKQALADLDIALASDATLGLAWLNKGNLLDRSGDKLEALECWMKAAQCDPLLKVPWVQCVDKGVSLLTQTRAKEAISVFDEALAMNPDFAEAWLQRGFALSMLRRQDDAVYCWNRAAQLQPDNGRLWFLIGNAHGSNRRFDEALDCLERAWKANQRFHQAILNKGAILADMGDLEGAAECFREAESANVPGAATAATICKQYLQLLRDAIPDHADIAKEQARATAF